ncbi:hypothetical protein BOX15_Mlig009301g3, partial [Macrostomum lignano]
HSMLLSVLRRVASRRCYSSSRLRLEELLPQRPGQSQDKPQVPDKLFTGRIAKWVGAPRVTEGWDMTKEHRGDLMRAMLIGLTTKSRHSYDDKIIRKRYQWIKQVQAFDTVLVEKFGVEVAAADRLVRLGCRVAFSNSPNDWLGVSETGALPALPSRSLPSLAIEAIDARDALLMSDSVDWLERLRSLQFLRLRRCPFVDDHLLARLAARCKTLKLLEISDCPGITWEGVASLWRLKNLRRLVLSENCHLLSQPEGLALVPTQLESLVPGLFVEGVDDLLALSVPRAAPEADSESVYSAELAP